MTVTLAKLRTQLADAKVADRFNTGARPWQVAMPVVR